MTLDDLKAAVGQEVGLSRWYAVEQAEIDAFADLTHDHNPLHIDAEAALGTEFGGTIAHGFLTLSLLAPMSYDVIQPLDGERIGLNYGFDRLRFVAPVPSGARIRARFVLARVEERGAGGVLSSYDVTVEIDGGERPALVTRWLQMRYLDG